MTDSAVSLKCSTCAYSAKISDKITYFHPALDGNCADYDASGLAHLRAAEENHFWFTARRAVIKRLFKKYVRAGSSVLEAGAGTGSVSAALLSAGYDVTAGEIHSNGLKSASAYGIKKLAQFDIYHPPYFEHFDAAGMFDVIEHLDNDIEALAEIRKTLKPGGILILTVPAHQWLWSRLDTESFHKRRYTRSTLKAAAASAGYEVIQIRFFFTFITPLLLLRRMIYRDNNQYKMTSKNEQFQNFNSEFNINPAINFILKIICGIEYYITTILYFPFGGSLATVCRKRL